MHRHCFSFFVIVGFLIYASCWDGKDRYLGKIPASTGKKIYFKLYQSNEFEQFTAISGEIVNEKDSLIKRQTFLRGTDLEERNTKNFKTGEYDGIVYLTYFHPNVIVALYDLKDNTGYPFDDKDFTQAYLDANILLKRLQVFDYKLVGYWNR